MNTCIRASEFEFGPLIKYLVICGLLSIADIVLSYWLLVKLEVQEMNFIQAELLKGGYLNCISLKLSMYLLQIICMTYVYCINPPFAIFWLRIEMAVLSVPIIVSGIALYEYYL